MSRKILFACPTNRWNSRERSLFTDLEIALKNGNKVVFYGLKNSPLDKKINKEQVEKFYHPGLVQTHFFLWPKLNVLAGLLEDKELSLVHCYKLNILWPICFFLRGNKEISVILSQFFEMKKTYRALWHRLLIRRCDLILVPYKYLIQNIWSRVGVHPRRIEVRHPNIRSAGARVENGVIFEKFEQFYSIGIYVSESDKQVNKFLPYLKALSVVNEHFDWKMPIKMIFVTEGLWSEKKVYQSLKQKVLDQEIEEHVVFHAGGTPCDYVQFFDLWMSLPIGEGLDDLAILAISLGTPILVPRNPSTVQFFDELGKVGETYRNDDVREIVRKWEMLLSDADDFREQIELASINIRNRYSHENQENQYLTLLERVISRRERYGHRKGNPNSFKLS